MGASESDAGEAIEHIEKLIRCESACLRTKQRWTDAVKRSDGIAETFERAVFFEILERSFDAEMAYLAITRKLGFNRP